MVDSSIYTVLVPLGRAIAGFLVGIMLGIVGGWTAITFNAMIGFPWSVEIHRNIYLVGIGLGAGAGAYLCWMNLSVRWYFMLCSALLVLAGGIVGTYVGYIYGQTTDPTYLGRAYTVDNLTHLWAAIGGITIATVLGLINEIRTLGR